MKELEQVASPVNEIAVSVDIERFWPVAKFMTEAIASGAHIHPLSSRPFEELKVKEAEDLTIWNKKVDIAFTYIYGRSKEGKPYSLEEIGQIFPGENGDRSRERVRQIIFGGNRNSKG